MNEPGIENQNEFFTITSRDEIRDRIKIDEICSSFESGWTQKSVSHIEQLALQIVEKSRSGLICELLAIDFEMRQVSDRQLSVEQYISQLPSYPQEIVDTIQEWLADTKASTPLVGKKANDIPEQVGDYRIFKVIGQGGTGTVYEAVQESLNRPVAIKTLTYPHVTSQMSRFQQEARAVAKLHHTNIVEVYGSGNDDGVAYFAMRLIDGNGLDQLIDATLQISGADGGADSDFLRGEQGHQNIAKVGSDVARALGHAHQQGVVHRDIKPSNLLVDRKGNTLVSDFGLAKLRNEDSNNTIDGSVVGTMRYVPPEAFSGKWSERGDIYSLGVTLYELLALAPAFSADDHPQLIKQITLRDRKITPLRQIDDSIPIDLETIVSKAMSFEPEDRYQSADEMADEFDRYLNGLPIKSRPMPPAEKLWRWAKRKPTAAALAILISAVAFIGLPIAIWLWLTASLALEVVESQREEATQLQRDAEASRYSSGVLLASNYIDDGLASDAKRLFSELEASQVSPPPKRTTFSDRWELDYLNQKLDTSKLTLKGDEKYGVWHVTIRPDDKQIATVHNGEPGLSSLEGEVILWNAQTGEVDKVLKDHGSRVFGCAYSHDGKQLATIGMRNDPDSDFGYKQFFRGSICLWDVESGNRINMVDLPGRYNGAYVFGFGTPVLPGIYFSDDDKKLISCPGSFEVREAQTLKRLWGYQHYFASTLLPNERVLAATNDGKSLVEFDLTTGKKLNSTKAFMAELNRFSFSSSRNKIANKAQNAIRIWDSIESLDKSREIAVPGIYWSSISPDGLQVAYSTRKGDMRIRPVDQSDPRGIRTFLGHESIVTAGAFSSDGKWMVTGSVDGTAKIWDLASPESKIKTNLHHDHIASFNFASDGDEFVYCTRKTDNTNQLNNAGTFAKDGSQLSKVRIETTYFAAYPRDDFSFSRDGSRMAAPISEPARPNDFLGYSTTGVVGVWDTSDWKQLSTIDTQLSQIVVTAWSTDNSILAIGGTKDGAEKIKFYLIEGGSAKPAGEISPSAVNISSMTFSESQQFAAGSSDEILIWQLSISELKKESSLVFGEPKRIPTIGRCASLDFSPDGSRLASADFSNDKLKVYDVRSAKLCYERSGPRRFCCVRYSPCGKRLALSGYDSIVHLCDSEFGYRLLTLNGCNSSPGTFSINSKVAFSPDGRRIATNNWLGEIAFWEITEPE